MAATGVRTSILSRGILGIALFAVSVITGQAQGNPEIRDRLSEVARGLSVGNPSLAMEPFDKSFDGYQKLRDFFIALTNAYQVESEVDVTDEDAAEDEAKLSVHWILHLTNAQTKNTENRSADLTLQWVRKKRKWMITQFAPLDLFDPAKVACAAQHTCPE